MEMPIYEYKAISRTGQSVQGNYTAQDKSQVLEMLRNNHYYPVYVKELVKGKEITFDLFQKVKIKDIVIFCRLFYTMLHAGVPIIQTIDILSKQLENAKLRKIMVEIYDELQKGSTFSESMKKHRDVFPELLLSMIEAGEVSGTLDIIMDRMAVHFEKESKIQSKVKGAMMYPAILSIVAVLVVIFLLTFVMPTFVSMFQGSGVELPAPTRVLLAISGFIQTYWYLLLFVTFALFFLFRVLLKTDAARLAWDQMKLRIPIIKGTLIKIATSRFTRTLSTLLRSGITLLEALEIAANVAGNKVVSNGILRAKEEVRKGLDLSVPLRELRVFPPMVDSMIRVGEESGTLDDVLERIADFYDNEVEAAIQSMTSLLEPIMIVIMALIIGSIVIAMVLPMFDMINTVQM